MRHNEPEIRRLHGEREANDDGFTYRYGRHKGGFVKRGRHSNGIERNRRADKRGARQAACRREETEAQQFIGLS